MNRPRTKILIDGDPQETRQIKNPPGFVDGQTTNPSLVANNPEIRDMLAAGHKLSEDEEMAEYRKIVQEVSPLVGEAGVSIEVFSDRKSKAQEMFDQGKEMYSWIPNAYLRVNLTLSSRNNKRQQFTAPRRIHARTRMFHRLWDAWTTSGKTAWT